MKKFFCECRLFKRSSEFFLLFCGKARVVMEKCCRAKTKKMNPQDKKDDDQQQIEKSESLQQEEDDPKIKNLLHLI